MNFEKISEDIYDGKKIKINKNDALRYLFYVIENYARDGKNDDFDATFGITVIEELVEYMRDITDRNWDKVKIEYHPMASSEMLIGEGE